MFVYAPTYTHLLHTYILYMHRFVYGLSLATALCRSSTLANTQLGSGNVVLHIIFVPLTHIWCCSCALNVHTHTQQHSLVLKNSPRVCLLAKSCHNTLPRKCAQKIFAQPQKNLRNINNNNKHNGMYIYILS